MCGCKDVMGTRKLSKASDHITVNALAQHERKIRPTVQGVL